MRGVIRKVGLSIVGLLFALIFMELFCRLSLSKSEYSFNSFATNDPRRITLNTNYYIFRPSSLLGYEHIPNSMPVGDEAIVSPRINSYGMVGKEYKLKKQEDTFRILVLGDSITEFNWYIENLEDKLNSSNLSSRYSFEIWNGGVCGYAVDQYANFLRHKGIKYNPDMVIISFCLNDFSCGSMVVFYKDEKGFTQYYYPAPYLKRIIPPNRFLFKHSYLNRFLIVRLENFLSQIHQEEEGIDAGERTGLYFLGKIKQICDNRKIPLFCVIFPYLKPLSEYNASQKEEYDCMLRVLKKLDVDYIDLHLYFPENQRYELREGKGDDIHPSEKGHRIAAKTIYNYLVNNYLKIQ